MLTLATVKVPDEDPKVYTIDVDVDDNDWAYIKQGDDWIAFPAKVTDDLIRALGNIRR